MLNFAEKNLKQGGTSIFVHESLASNNNDLQKHCIEQDIETCAIKIKLLATYIYVISIYRSPTGNFANFIKGIDAILNQLYKPNIEIIICGDINVNYLDENCNKRQQLDALVATYNLISTVRFPTRSLNGTASAIDNIFIDISHSGIYLSTGDRLDIANFRPISLLISFSKILEKIIAKRIQEHATQYQMVAKEQYGFRSSVSTDNASHTLTL